MTLLKRLLKLGLLLFLATSVALVSILEYFPAPTSAFMLNRHLRDYANGQTYRNIDYHWIESSEISKHVFAAVIASEDQQFYQHNGFDLAAIGKAFRRYIKGGGLHGASTISQQVAKNLFLSPSKNFLRKGLEIWFTSLIELLWSKSRILETYVNIAEFGDHLFGIEAASRHYFKIPAKQLSREQAALLAATLPNPLMFRADKPSAYLYKRQSWILGQMRNF